MSQSTIIFGSLVLAFIVFVTVKGELPQYFRVIGIGSAA